MSNLLKRMRQWLKGFVAQERDSRYVFVLFFGLLIFSLTALQALHQGWFDSIERPVFGFINGLPTALFSIMFAVTQLGGLGGLILWCGLGWYWVNARAAKTVLATGVAAWLVAKLAKVSVHRGRPGALLEHINHFAHETFSGYGFPSGHSTLSAACAAALYYQVKPRYRKYLLLAVLAVGISRMYLGAHFPLDVVGGWGLGMAIGASVALVAGNSGKSISAQSLKKILRRKGYELKSLHFADVDARGSRPFFMEDIHGKKYFAKIFGKQEYAADWLFKIYRFFRYKNLQAEEPYMNSKRNVELESLATLWAAESGARVAKICDLIQINALWVLVQERIDGTAMSAHGQLRDASLVDTWRQVEKLHASRLAHRDLRAANLLIDKKGQAWVIDFGFAEVSARPTRMYMDVAELLMSMSAVVGVKRTVTAALKVVPRAKLERTLPYLQKAVFSGATTKQLKQKPELLQELKDALTHKLHIEEEVEDANILRINARKVINFTMLAVFTYVIVPQFKLFRGTLESLSDIHSMWLIVAIIASILTYYFTAIIYVALADIPLKLIRTSLVQLAASFVTKIVPGGLGSTTINARYLKKAGMDGASITALLVSQGAIGFVMFALPLGLFLFFNGAEASSLLPNGIKLSYLFVALAVIIASLLVVSFSKKLRTLVIDKITQFVSSLRDMTTAPRDVSLAAGAALLVTLAYIACLYACAHAIGIQLGVGAAVLIYASAVIAKTAIPTPGGLGPLEVAMVATMVGLGIAKGDAFSAVVLYRLLTFWLPIPFSLLSYRYIQKKKFM